MTSPRNSMTDAVAAPGGGSDMLTAYDPARERDVVRRLRRQRWRRIALTSTAIGLAAFAAGAFTIANRDAIVAGLSGGPAAAPQVEPAPAAAAPAAPALASAHSQAVTLPPPSAHPPKVQARIIVPAEPQPIRPPAMSTEPETDQAGAPAGESQRAAAPGGIRQVPLGGARAIDQAAPVATPAPPAAALGFVAPVPPPRPANAP